MIPNSIHPKNEGTLGTSRMVLLAIDVSPGFPTKYENCKPKITLEKLKQLEDTLCNSQEELRQMTIPSDKLASNNKGTT